MPSATPPARSWTSFRWRGWSRLGCGKEGRGTDGYTLAALLSGLGAVICLGIWLGPDWGSLKQAMAARLRRALGLERAREDLAQAGLSWLSEGGWIGIRGGISILIALLAFAVFRVLVLSLLGGLISYHLIGLALEARRRRVLLERQRALLEAIGYGAAVMSRGGNATEMLKALARTGPYLARGIFSELLDPAKELEQSSVTAVRGLRERLADPLFDDLALALELHWRRGAKLVPALEALTQDWDQALRLEREAKAMRAGVEASVVLLTLLPIGFLLLLQGMAPAMLAPFRSPGGQVLLGLAVAWMVLGHRVLQRMSEPPRQERLRLKAARP